MKSIFKTFVLMLISFSLFAQQDNILTKADNLAWLENFKKIETKAEQIEAIKAKIIADTSYIYPTGIDRIILQQNPDLKKADCKIAFIFNGIVINEQFVPNAYKLINLITEKNIDKISIHDEAVPFYGTSTCVTVITLISEKRSVFRKMNKALKK